MIGQLVDRRPPDEFRRGYRYAEIILQVYRNFDRPQRIQAEFIEWAIRIYRVCEAKFRHDVSLQHQLDRGAPASVESKRAAPCCRTGTAGASIEARPERDGRRVSVPGWAWSAESGETECPSFAGIWIIGFPISPIIQAAVPLSDSDEDLAIRSPKMLAAS